MKKNKVLIFGTFDGIHPGHKSLLSQASALGDELHVVIARDQTVNEIKGRPPEHDENARLHAIQILPEVTKSYLGCLDDKYRIIELIQPDIIALGYDQHAFTNTLETELAQRKIKANIVRLNPFYPEKYKSSIIRNQKNA